MKECSHGLIWSAMGIENYVTGRFHDQLWRKLWIRPDERVWWHDLIWGALNIGTNV
jgi:hypothetical protein